MSPLDTRPDTVALVALGPTNAHYALERGRKKKVPSFDEVWTVNSGVNYLKCDKAWIMDDLKLAEKDYPEWCLRLKSETTPIITCRAYPEYPSSIAFPLEEVLANLKDDYLAVTPAYMIAYAIHIGVRNLYIYGCDFTYPGNLASESGSACVAYWLGIARERKMVFRIPQDSTLLDAHMTRVDEGKVGRRYLYGYDYNPGRSYARINEGRGTALDRLVAVGGKVHTIDKAPAKPEEKVKPAQRANGADSESLSVHQHSDSIKTVIEDAQPKA